MSATVYRMYDDADRLLYVGISVAWPKRLYDHEGKAWFGDVARVTLEHFADHQTALRAEGQAQEDEEPVYNVVRNGRVPNARERNAKRRAERTARIALEEADRLLRGVYVQWANCRNCMFNERIEIPLGTPRDQHPCDRCGVRPSDRKSLETHA